MRNKLLILTVLLALLFLTGGSEALIDVLIRLVILGSVQLMTSMLNEKSEQRSQSKVGHRKSLKRRSEGLSQSSRDEITRDFGEF